jgi:hypothetical protein
MTRTRLVRVAAVCAVTAAASLIVAGSTSADSPSRQDFAVAALAIPAAPATNVDDDATRFDTAHGYRAKIDTVATASLNCNGCSSHAFTVHVVYALRPHTVVADNVATAWASACEGCSGWALSLQIVVARSARALTAANRALAFTADCDHCSVKAAAVQIVVIAASERQLAPRQIDSIQALYGQLLGALTPAASPAAARPQTQQATPNQATGALTTATERIQAIVAAGLHATSATHAVTVR